MNSFANRLAADLAATWGYLVATASLTAALTLTLYLFTEEGPKVPPAQWRGSEPIYLRVVDPEASLVQEITSLEQVDESPLASPAAQALRAAVAEDDRVYLALTPSMLRTASELPNFRLLVGSAPAGLPTEPGTLLLWGATAHDAQQISEALGLPTRLAGQAFDALDGSGYEIVADFVITADWETIERVGLHPMRRTEFSATVVCVGCEITWWRTLATELTAADRAAGADVVYFAVTQPELQTSADLLYAEANRMDRIQLGAAWLAGIIAALVGGAALWQKRVDAFLIDLSQGAGRWQLHARTQALVALGVTIPALATLAGMQAVWSALSVTVEVPEAHRLAVFAVVPAAQAVLGVAAATQVEMLLRRMW